ncbi:Site-specific recombinase XerD [Chitinophaga eiseniae]|uniref:Site-specific recombinase XerD n=1 Tax=Chitinophaga eiseniae TaxID=634771 RepID=A0A1T4SWE4_9BACT|nr:site-specific integrase [Chitinophaga eiseniae]SKA32584.1 Site-specific recombinase XerD [Chitinophaga eiseniae]
MEQTQTTYGVSFFPKTERTKIKTGNALLYCRITVKGKPTDFSLQKTIDKTVLKTAKGKGKSNDPDVLKLRHFLDQVKGKVTHHYDELKLRNQPITGEILKIKLLGLEQNTNSLCELFSYHNKTCGLKRGTVKNYLTTFAYIQNYLKAKKRTDILLSELDYAFMLEFGNYIANNPIDPLNPLTNNGTMKHLERTRKVGGLAVKMGWLKHHPFRQFRLKFDKVQRSYLSDTELAAVEVLAFNDPMLQLVHDLFVFACYTSPHYSDTINLKREEIVEGVDHTPWIRQQREKNAEPVLIPLLPISISIIEKYRNDPRAIARGTVFPYVSNKTVNDKLKIIGYIAGHPRPLRFKDARHTFATTVMLTNGMPIESVSKMMGHTKISTTQIYGEIVAAKLSEDMKNLRQKLASK